DRRLLCLGVLGRPAHQLRMSCAVQSDQPRHAFSFPRVRIYAARKLAPAMAQSEITDRYDPDAIERKWQLVWEAENTWVVANPGSPEFDASKPKSYVLEMLPYP